MDSQNFLDLISIDISMKFIIMNARSKPKLNFGCFLIFDIFFSFEAFKPEIFTFYLMLVPSFDT